MRNGADNAAASATSPRSTRLLAPSQPVFPSRSCHHVHSRAAWQV